MCVSAGEGVQWLRRNGIEQRIDRIGVSGCQSVIGLEPEPGRVLFVDVVIDASRLHLLVRVA